jgi:hypothetical protein
LTPEQRHQWYKRLKLRADVFADGRVEISWAGSARGNAVRETATLSRVASSVTDNLGNRDNLGRGAPEQEIELEYPYLVGSRGYSGDAYRLGY